MSIKNSYSAKPLQLATRTITAKNGIFVYGILNCTPDSFFANSRVSSLQSAKERALKMIEDGADIIDIGAESTRPGSDYVSSDEEIARMIPVIKEIRKFTDCPISVDTRKFDVFRAAFDAGADILNDISALEDDANLAKFVAQNKTPVILMHKRSSPTDMMQKVCYNDVVGEVANYLQERANYAQGQGVQKEKIILDPGIGFAKKLNANCALIKHADKFSIDGTYHVLIGASRKTCVAELIANNKNDLPLPQMRLSGTLAMHLLAVQHGATMLRVHDVKECVDTIKVLRGVENYDV